MKLERRTIRSCSSCSFDMQADDRKDADARGQRKEKGNSLKYGPVIRVIADGPDIRIAIGVAQGRTMKTGIGARMENHQIVSLSVPCKAVMSGTVNLTRFISCHNGLWTLFPACGVQQVRIFHQLPACPWHSVHLWRCRNTSGKVCRGDAEWKALH